jgi:chromosome segregation ATPase
VHLKLLIAAVIAAAVMALPACGDDESDAEKAQNQVCDARADIEKQVKELGNLDLATATRDQIQQNLNAIKDDLGKMKDAESDLNADRRRQVESATNTFQASVDDVASGLGESKSLSSAVTQFQNSLRELQNSYQQALAPIDC